jgi:hypothetical protein
MKKSRIFRSTLWAAFFSFLFVLSLCELLFKIPVVNKYFTAHSQMVKDELFDNGLARINSLEKLELYTDSLSRAVNADPRRTPQTYTTIVSNTVRERFYHGYLTYTLGNNFLAMLAGKITGRSYDAVIEADDILKANEADCRQQCLVMMELFRSKSYPVRAVFLDDRKRYGGHYTFEAYYDKDWHLFDPDAEPNTDVLLQGQRPSIAKLVADTAMLVKAYANHDRERVLTVFPQYKYGPINELIPMRLYIFHGITKFLSWILWFILLIAYLVTHPQVVRRYRMSGRLDYPIAVKKGWQQTFNSLFF